MKLEPVVGTPVPEDYPLLVYRPGIDGGDPRMCWEIWDAPHRMDKLLLEDPAALFRLHVPRFKK